eukprot:160294-Prymnesium_polylepis.1
MGLRRRPTAWLWRRLAAPPGAASVDEIARLGEGVVTLALRLRKVVAHGALLAQVQSDPRFRPLKRRRRRASL